MLMKSAIAYVSFMFCLFFMVFILGCGEECEDTNTSAGTGAAAVNLIWPDEDLEQRNIQAKGDICNDKGISIIKVDVYDGSFNKYLTGKTFPCTDGEGTVYGIASGKDRIFKLSGLNDQGETLYVGEQKGIEIITGKVASVGFIIMHRSGNLPPTAFIDTSVHGSNPVFTEGEEITFKGTGHDEEDGELTGDALVWKLDDNEIGTGGTCTLSGLDIGAHDIILTVTDDDQATGHYLVKFSVNEPGNNIPVATIISPPDDQSYEFASEIKFQGKGTDKDSDNDTLIFEWELGEKPLGTGREFSKKDIPAGNHLVTLRVKDDAGGMGTATVKITVLKNEKPEATIIKPQAGSYIYGQPIEFIGTGTDKESSVLKYTWYSSKEGKNIGTDWTFTKSNLTVGTHQITLTVEDEHNEKGTATVNILVKENESPKVSIVEFPKYTYIYGEPVTFTGTGEDKEDDDATLRFQWWSSIDDDIGTEPEFTISDLSVGTHTITLSVTDQYDGTGTASVTIKIFGGFTNSMGMTFRAPKTTFPAIFLMGSPKDEPERLDNETLHEVTLTQPFFMQTTEVTNAQYAAFLNNVNKRGPEGEPWFETKDEDSDSHIIGSTGNFNVESGYENHPVIFVSWYGAKAFADWLSRKEDKNYRLPTEAEWEYAARADTDTPFYFGKCLSTDQANYRGSVPLGDCLSGEYRGTTTEVANLEISANAWGLYDMHGNVWEWCYDWFESDYYKDSPLDPTGPPSGLYRVLRGGCWYSRAGFCRSASRGVKEPGYRDNRYGFRLALHPGQQ